MTNLDKILDEIEERANSATEGPFVIEKHNHTYHITNGLYGDKRKIYAEDLWNKSLADFIAASRTDVPKLVKALGCAVEQLNFNASLYSSEAKEYRSKQALKQIESILGGE